MANPEDRAKFVQENAQELNSGARIALQENDLDTSKAFISVIKQCKEEYSRVCSDLDLYVLHLGYAKRAGLPPCEIQQF